MELKTVFIQRICQNSVSCGESSLLVVFQWKKFHLIKQWPNLKNLSGGLNMPRLKYGWFYLKLYQYFNVLNLNWVLGDLNRGSNS